MDQPPILYKVSKKKNLSEEELDYAANLLIEADAIMENNELYNNILDEANKKSKVYRNLKSIREAFNEMALNPGKTRGDDDEPAPEPKAKKSKSKKED